MRFLQRINIYLYVLFLLLIIFLAPKTFAYYNTDTSFNLTMQNYDLVLKNTSCGENGSFYEVVNDFIDNTSTQYYDLVVGPPVITDDIVSSIRFYIKWKSNIQYRSLQYYGFNSSPSSTLNLKLVYSSNTDRVPYLSITNNTCSNYQNTSGYTMFKNLTDTGNYNSATTTGDFNYNFYGPMGEYSSYMSFGSNYFSNDLSYNTDTWYYYSSSPFLFGRYNYTNNSVFNKKLCISDNDTCYVLNDTLPSYYDIHHNDEPEDTSSFIGYKESLDTFYTSLLPSNISNYNLKINFKTPQSLLGFYQTPQEYIDNTSFNYICSGRINNSNYYSYETFNCSLSSSYVITNENTIEYTFNNLSLEHTLTNYDKIFITIKSNYLDSNISTTLFDLKYTYNLGSFYNTEFKGSIYEDFTSLPLNFKIYFSSNNTLANSNLYTKKYNFINYGLHYIGFSNISQNQNLVYGTSILGTTLNSDSSDFISTNVSNDIDTGIMIYQQDSAIPLPRLDLFFNAGIIVSINNTSNNEFYYIDNTGTIQNSTFTIPISSDNTKYDISYYVQTINNFLDDKKDSIYQLSILTQSFYNELPFGIQSSLFVVFIFFCLLLIFMLIKRR